MSEGEANPIEQLKQLREELIEHRTALAYRVHGPSNYEAMEKLVAVHHSIDALTAVIDLGAEPPTSPWEDPDYKMTFLG